MRLPFKDSSYPGTSYRSAVTTAPIHRLLSEAVPGDHDPAYEAEESLWGNKLDESLEKGLDESISQNGVRTPLDVVLHPDGSMLLADGHHRAITAAALDPDMEVPVEVMKNDREKNRWGDRW